MFNGLESCVKNFTTVKCLLNSTDSQKNRYLCLKPLD